MSSTEVNTGVYTQFTEKTVSLDEMPNAAVASASIPMIFPPHVWQGRGVYMDGMTAYNLNAQGAIESCMDGVVDDESKIIIDVLICGSNTMTTETETGNAWENYFRGRDIGKFYGDSNSLVYTMKAHPTVQFRYIVQQSVGKMSGLDELKFDGQFTWPA